MLHFTILSQIDLKARKLQEMEITLNLTDYTLIQEKEEKLYAFFFLLNLELNPAFTETCEIFP